MKKILFLFIIIFLLAAGCSKDSRVKNFPPNTPTPTAALTPTQTQSATPSPVPSIKISLVAPISNAKERITKKFFGTYVTPKNSPISPEKFTGYHTGLDFETFPEEQNVDVPIKVICTGTLLQKRIASGYGGVAVQKCTLNNEVITLIYGHMRLSSVKATVNTELKAGDQLGVLGTGYSTETDGERKHLHLGIHKGDSINIKGYVQNKNELSGWIDPQSVLGF